MGFVLLVGLNAREIGKKKRKKKKTSGFRRKNKKVI